VLPD